MLKQMVKRTEDASCGDFSTGVPGLNLFRFDQPRQFEALIYEPLVCLILQGRKVVRVGGVEVVVSAGQCIVVSHSMPVVSRIEPASAESPYLALVVCLDMAELRSLDGVSSAPDSDMEAWAFSVGTEEPKLQQVFDRYLALAEEPEEVGVMAPLIRRELHFRLLRSPAGTMLRRLLHRDSHASNISQAIATLRETYREKVEVGDLARSVGMSPSSFYKHFKATTRTTPLQFQKNLRLTEARRLLFGGQHSVSTAAFFVGYESASQFSREYTRKFGTPPSLDLPGAA